MQFLIAKYMPFIIAFIEAVLFWLFNELYNVTSESSLTYKIGLQNDLQNIPLVHCDWYVQLTPKPVSTDTHFGVSWNGCKVIFAGLILMPKHVRNLNSQSL